MYNTDLALNNQQWLICHETKSNHTIFWGLDSVFIIIIIIIIRWSLKNWWTDMH